jgi:hypothetical protein
VSESAAAAIVDIANRFRRMATTGLLLHSSGCEARVAALAAFKSVASRIGSTPAGEIDRADASSGVTSRTKLLIHSVPIAPSRATVASALRGQVRGPRGAAFGLDVSPATVIVHRSEK